MSKVVDVILHRNKYNTQEFLVLDNMPDFKYEEKIMEGRRVLIAKDGIFSSLYYFQQPDQYAKAFAGREFKIPMKDGSFIIAKGQWWHGHSDADTVSVGISTVEELAKCNVFSSIDINRGVFDSLINKRKNPSNNYNKYAQRGKDCGKHTIISRWENIEKK